ncbi:MAG TPA: amino acid adenylation domain-containing protein, partial [Ktedonobacteraceae bacterium]|nr:amino acid adenylation domain-containing protein [Ktedonobacteraceae bacterium]
MAELISSQAQLADQPRIVQRPLSFAQERLWFLQQFLPPSAASIYHVTLAFRLHGELRLELLEQSLLRMTERHEILRTCFPSSKGIPYQKTLPLPDRFVQPTIDMRDLDTRQLSSAIQAEMDLFQLERFDLEHGPLWRCQVLLLREQEYLLLFNLHHIITDDWSINLFLNELALHYNALLAQQQIQLPAPSLQYADYIQQLRQRQQEGKLAEHEAYWKQKLADAPTTLLLPLDHPRPAVQRFRGEQVPLRLAPELTHQLEQLCRGEQSTLFMGLLAAFQLVLSRLSGQSDLVVGIPIAERGSPELEQMMGFFVHTLPIRVRIPEGLSYREILRQVREATLGAYDHQDMPFEQMVNILHPARDLSIQPFIQTFFAYQNIIISELQLQNIVAEHYPLRQQTARYELLLELFPSPQGIYGHIEYDRDLFDYETIKRWTEHFKTLLQAIVSEPDCALDTLSLLTSAQYLQIVEIWNRTTQPLHEQMIHQLFETYAASTPENLALVFQDQRLTYRQLEERANQLAHYLHQQGVGPEIRVGICLERSIELIVSVLAILKAGGAFVPLDPSYPRARLIHMQKDAQVKIILTQEPFLTRIAQDGIQIVCLEQMHAIIAQQPSTALAASASLDTLCYIIYTSGSTGLPKGVMVPHRGVYNLVMAEKEILQLPPASRVLQFFSYSFDAFLLDLGLSLLAGSTLYIGTSDEIFPGPPLHAFLQKHAIQCMLCSPSALALLPEAHLPDLHTVITGGEVCPADLVARWSPARRFLNLYGPTEITVCATFAECKATTARPPIGKPLANTRVYVLDARLQPVPVGVAGELYIGGIGITRGYCNQPDLTAERFLPDPFSQEPGARLYRSGDLVRWLLDGSLDYLGRSDQQVKIRGFRIESGEIESALRSHPLVYDAVVAVRGDGSSLTAYIVTDGVDLPGTALREFLLRSLPEYMVPSHYVFLSAFPTMPGGKVDRKALAALEQAGIPSAREYIPPQSREEEQLALIWQELLHLPQIGRSDDFFASGGHSLLAAQMLDRLRTTFHVDISVRQIFQNPTLSSLAQLVSRPPDSYVEEPEILPARNRRPAHIPLSFAQEQLWFLDQLFPESANYTTPFALEIQGDLNIEALEQSLMQLIQRHEILRTCFPASQGKPYQHILPSLSHIFTVEDLQHLELELQQQRIHQALQAANLHIFQLATGPLLFVSLLQCAPRRSLFILTMHHIIVDGWSFGILLQELTSLYQAACANEKADLPPLE